MIRTPQLLLVILFSISSFLLFGQDVRRDIKVRPIFKENGVLISNIKSLSYFDGINTQNGDILANGTVLFQMVKLGNSYVLIVEFTNSDNETEIRRENFFIAKNSIENQIDIEFISKIIWYEIKPEIVSTPNEKGIPNAKLTIGLNDFDTTIRTNSLGKIKTLKIPHYKIISGQKIILSVRKEGFEHYDNREAEFNVERVFSKKIKLKKQRSISGIIEHNSIVDNDFIEVKLTILGTNNQPKVDTVSTINKQFYFSLPELNDANLQNSSFIIDFFDSKGNKLNIQHKVEGTKYQSEFRVTGVSNKLGTFFIVQTEVGNASNQKEKKFIETKFYQNFIQLQNSTAQMRIGFGPELRTNSGIEGEGAKANYSISLQYEQSVFSSISLIGGIGWGSAITIELPSKIKFISGEEKSFDPIEYNRSNYGRLLFGVGNNLHSEKGIRIFLLGLFDLNGWKSSSFLIKEGDLQTRIKSDTQFEFDFSTRIGARIHLGKTRFSFDPFISYSFNNTQFDRPNYEFDFFGQANRREDFTISFKEQLGFGFNLTYMLNNYDN